jgi:integrase-like protein/endosialidase-like protein
MGVNSEKLVELRPVSFAYKEDTQHVKHYGLIAEEVATVYPELVTHTATGEAQTVRYQELIPMARRGDGILLRGRTFWLDCRINGQRHTVRLGKGITPSAAREIAQVKRSAILRDEVGIGRKKKDWLFDEAVTEFLAWAKAEKRPNTARAACRLAGLTDVTPHVLRHTFAIRLAMAGVDLRTIQELGGWESLGMVQRYAHLSPSHKAEAVERLAHFTTRFTPSATRPGAAVAQGRDIIGGNG